MTRLPGVAALTAGPGVTNGMSAMAAAQQNQSPLVVLGGRAPALRWGMGSLQEIDHVPFVAPLARFAATAQSADDAGRLVDEALRAAVECPVGCRIRRLPDGSRVLLSEDDGRPGALDRAAGAAHPGRRRAGPRRRPAGRRERPVIMAGTNVWWGHAEAALLRLAEERQIPVLMNGMARGVVPADHRLAFSRARAKALGEADVALVVGVPMDFRLGFGAVFGSQTQLVVADRAEPEREHPRPVAAGLYGDLTPIPSALAASGGAGHRDWIERLRTAETARARPGKGRTRRRPDPVAPDAGVRRAGAHAGPRRHRGDRRRRLRFLCGPGDRQLSAGLLAGQRALRLSWFGPRLRTGGQAGPTGPSSCPAARRRRIRLQRHGMGHPGPAQSAGRVGDRQQRNLGPRKASDGGDLRLFGGRGVASRDPLRRGGARPGRPRRAGVRARSSCGPRWTVPSPAACPPSSTCSPTRASPIPGDRTSPDGSAFAVAAGRYPPPYRLSLSASSPRRETSRTDGSRACHVRYNGASLC